MYTVSEPGIRGGICKNPAIAQAFVGSLILSNAEEICL